ncbi:NAD(P)-binding protein [Phlegmacium glaucopus]|nr:NAD(P)-binding protein [Phlegmacium glaucopus]
MTKTNIFLTGATGYIGGTVLSRFLKHPDVGSFNITVLVRSPEKAEKLKAFGVNPVVGSHSDTSLMENLTAQTDVVIAVADCDDLVAAKATLKGLKTRYQTSGIAPIFIHTSGTGVLADNALGDNLPSTIYDDTNPDQLETLPDTQIHRDVELELLNADKEGYVKAYIISPSMVYGIATGELVEQGIQKAHSISIPWFVEIALARGRAGMVGPGKNIWPNVDIQEVADIFVLLYNSIVSNPGTGHGREGVYFAANGEHDFYQVSKAIGEALMSFGKVDDPEPTTLTKEEFDKYFWRGSTLIGTNCHAQANRARSIGWTPVKTTKDFLESIKIEVEVLVGKSEKV